MSIKAYATVRLTGCNIRRFINLCTANHIKIWNLKYVSPKEYEACCSTEDIFLTKPHLKKTHTRLLVVKRQGYFAIRAFLYKIRIITAAITGVFCIHALICTRIWHIVPEGNRFTYDESVISFMESENITIGSHKRAIGVTEILLFMIGIPSSFSICSPTSTSLAAFAVIFL